MALSAPTSEKKKCETKKKKKLGLPKISGVRLLLAPPPSALSSIAFSTSLYSTASACHSHEAMPPRRSRARVATARAPAAASSQNSHNANQAKVVAVRDIDAFSRLLDRAGEEGVVCVMFTSVSN